MDTTYLRRMQRVMMVMMMIGQKYIKKYEIRDPYLGCHDSLSFSNQSAFRAHAVLPSAVSLVSFQSADHPVIAATGTFRRSRVLVVAAYQHCSRCSLVGTVLIDTEVIHGTGTSRSWVWDHVHHLMIRLMISSSDERMKYLIII